MILTVLFNAISQPWAKLERQSSPLYMLWIIKLRFQSVRLGNSLRFQNIIIELLSKSFASAIKNFEWNILQFRCNQHDKKLCIFFAICGKI